MLTKCKDVRRLNPEKSVYKQFENALCEGRIQSFLKAGKESQFDIFFGRITFKQIEKQKRL